MIKKTLMLLAFTNFFAGSFAYAENLDPATIKSVHDQVVVSLADKCMKEMKSASDEMKATLPAVCHCIGNKAQANLDDAALAKCANDDSGSDCITKAVSTAAEKAMTQESVNACIAENVNTPAAPVPGDRTIPKAVSAEPPKPLNAPQ